MLPLYREFQLRGTAAHPGLLFDKFANEWAPQWHANLPDGAKKKFFKKFADIDYTYLEKDLKAHLDRQESLIGHLCRPNNPATLPVKTDWRFISGLGSGHPYETGFIWHRTLGVPYLPGSSVKGMMRAWAEQWCGDNKEIQKSMVRLFGAGTENDEDRAGSLIVFDALPLKPPKLELDILNPHYQPYYESNGDKPPADYYNPVPVFFLTVAPKQPFRFCLAPRPGAASDDPAGDLATGVQLLEDALWTIGAGGKTAVGYGIFFQPPAEKEKALPKEERWRQELSRMEPKQLANQFSRNWSKTKKRYEDDLQLYAAVVWKNAGQVIHEWQESKNANEKKAYDRLHKLITKPTQKRNHGK